MRKSRQIFCRQYTQLALINHNSLVLVDVEGDEGEHAGVDEEHHEDGAQEPDELALPAQEQTRAGITGKS